MTYKIKSMRLRTSVRLPDLLNFMIPLDICNNSKIRPLISAERLSIRKEEISFNFLLIFSNDSLIFFR